MSRAERFLFRVEPGKLVPADEATRERLREKGYHAGDVLSAQLFKPRNVGFHRKIHAFGRLISENVSGFEGLPAHQTIKRLQVEADACCDHMVMNFPGVGPVSYRLPQTMAFADMDDGDAAELFDGLCKYVVKAYWPSLTAEQVEEMAEMMQ